MVVVNAGFLFLATGNTCDPDTLPNELLVQLCLLGAAVDWQAICQSELFAQVA